MGGGGGVGGGGGGGGGGGRARGRIPGSHGRPARHSRPPRPLVHSSYRSMRRQCATRPSLPLHLQPPAPLPVKVLAAAQCHQAVGRGELGEDADVVAVFKLAARRLGEGGMASRRPRRERRGRRRAAARARCQGSPPHQPTMAAGGAGGVAWRSLVCGPGAGWRRSVLRRRALPPACPLWRPATSCGCDGGPAPAPRARARPASPPPTFPLSSPPGHRRHGPAPAPDRRQGPGGGPAGGPDRARAPGERQEGGGDWRPRCWGRRRAAPAAHASYTHTLAHTPPFF